MKLDMIGIITKDIKKAVEFYETLGFKMIDSKIELAFLCDSTIEVDALYNKMVTAGYESFKAPWDAFWGQRYAIIKDIDGNLLSLFANQ